MSSTGAEHCHVLDVHPLSCQLLGLIVRALSGDNSIRSSSFEQFDDFPGS